MGNIDADYLWLHQQTQRRAGLRRIAVVLVVCLVAGTAWLITGSRSAERDHGAQELADNNDEARDAARVGPTQQTNRLGEPLLEAPAARLILDTTYKASHHDLAHIPLAIDTRLGLYEQAAPVGKTLTMPDPGRAADARAPAARPGPQTAADTAADAAGAQWQTITIESGDTLSIAFNRHGLSYRDSLNIAHLPKYGSRFTQGLKAGDSMRVRADDDGHVLALNYPIDTLHRLDVRPRADGFRSRMVRTNVVRRKAYATGVIDNSFYIDALQSGLSERQVMKLVNIFRWDIDFALDIRRGDRFVVVFDEFYRHGEKVGTGPLLAASFTSGGHQARAVRYTRPGHASAFYSPDGRPMKKAFIRTPVDYTRISSGFSLARKHPVLNRIRKHEGTDYAAPRGTPIEAAGSGRVIFRGRRGGYGNMIILRHGPDLTTRYGHMRRFARGLAVGSKVRQGQVIGYVGMSGLATGPHLHYEFRVDGQPKDPQTVKLPRTNAPLAKRYIAAFKRRAAPLLAELKTLGHNRPTRVADNGRHSVAGL